MTSIKKMWMTASCSFAIFSLWANLASAAFILSGNFTTLNAPVDVRVGQTESDTNAFFFQEQSYLLLGPGGVNVNLSAPGTANIGNAFNPSFGNVGANQRVDVFYVHMDAVDPTPAKVYGINTITFDQPVLGVVLKTAQFTSSKFLELPLPSRYSAAGGGPFEGNVNFLTLDATRKILTFRAIVGGAADDIRIITATAVPEPGTLLLMLSGLGMAAVAGRRRLFAR